MCANYTLIASRGIRYQRIVDAVPEMRRKLILDKNLFEIREDDELREFEALRETDNAYYQYEYCEEEINKTKRKIRWVKRHLEES